MRTRVKICGITRAADLDAAVEAGADAVGLVFHPRSKRALTPQDAVRLAQRVPAFVTVVGLFLDEPAALVRQVLETVPLELLQFHGTESAEYCRSFGRRYVKAVAMGGDAGPGMTAYHDAVGLLVDSHAPGELGGTGRTFDWDALAGAFEGRPVILAGGLRPENVAAAVTTVRPYAVDVSSGVESAPGVKDAGKIKAFVDEVKRARDEATTG